MARCSVCGQTDSRGSRRSSARSSSPRRAARYPIRSGEAASVAIVVLAALGTSGLELRRRPLLGRLLQHDLDRLLDLRKLLVAEPRELHALLKERELLLERPILPLELGDDRLEARHRLLEVSVL